MEVYLADLRAWPLKTVLRVLEEWPLRSEFWPTWKELKELRSEFYEAYERPVLPPPSAPEHKPFIAKAEPPGLSSKAAWDAHQQALLDLTDPNKPVFGGPSMRAALLKLGKTIEARNRQHAERMGWI